MKMPNFLVLVTEEIKLEKKGKVNYLFPLKDYCVGFTKEFSLEEINMSDSYVYLNRILDTKSIENFQKLLPNLPRNIKGIVFEDLGIYELIKETTLEKILYASHANCSIKTINAYLEKMDSVVISPDITEEETKEILKNAKKPVIVYGLGHLPYMYSRRTLNSNYANHFHYQPSSVLELKESITKMPFFAVENHLGTVLYDKKIYNASSLQKEKNIKFILINPFQTNLSLEEALTFFLENIGPEFTTGFLHQKTIYRLKQTKENE